MKSLRRFILALSALVLVVTGCSSTQSSTGDRAKEPQESALNVYATTGYLADAVKNIAPDSKITTMVGPGGDPHTYQPSTKDIEAMRSADVVLWNGLHLEAQMIDQLKSLGDKQLAVGDKLPEDLLLPWPETDHEGKPLHDPHVWNSPKAWLLVVDYVTEKLSEKRPDRADEFTANAAKYKTAIEDAAKEADKLLSEVAEPRILITGHDAFNYFGKTYNLEVRATDFVSTEAKLSAEELSDLAKLIADKKVPVIFQDNQANPQAITSLKEAVRARGWNVEVSNEELFADSLGESAPVDTYLGAFTHNATVVAEALKKS